MNENRSVKTLTNPFYFILSQIVWNFFFILGSIAIATIFLYTLKIIDFNPGMSKLQADDRIVYVGKNKEVFDRAYSGITYAKTIEDQDFVLVDNGYSFMNADNYHKVCSYGDRIVLASKEMPTNIMMEIKKVLDPNIHTLSDMGFKYADFDAIVYVCAPYNHTLVASYVAANSPNHEFTGKVSYMQGNLKPKGINIMLKTDLDMVEGYYELTTDETIPTYMKFDLYARNDIDLSTELPVIEGMDILGNIQYNVVSPSDIDHDRWEDIIIFVTMAIFPSVFVLLSLAESKEDDKMYLDELGKINK